MKTDSQLPHDVTAELERDGAVHAEHIGVEVRDGIVTLCGRVAGYAEKLHAESAALRVRGVRSLTVEIEVIPPTSLRRTDTDIARAANGALQWMTYLPTHSVNVTVERGWITLNGELDWEHQKQAAIDAVRHLEGVLDVSDHITIKARPMAKDAVADPVVTSPKGSVAS